jgi:hypothetical protein
MTQNIEEFANQRKHRFDWVAILPKRKAWLQTLILLPFGLPIANFLGASWNFSVSSIVETQQYPQAICSMVFNLFLPSLFMAFIFHWGWFIWRQSLSTWYPNGKAFWAGTYATLTIALSFAIVEIFNKNMGVCGNGGWGAIGDNLFCNLNGYGFESKSWFGVWFIIAAYCYQSQSSLQSLYQRYFPKAVKHDMSIGAIEAGEIAPDDFGSNNPLDTIRTGGEE